MSNPERRRARGVGEIANEAILAGKTDQEALAAVLSALPGASTNLGNIAWYRSQLRRKGRDAPTARELKQLRVAPAAATQSTRTEPDDLALLDNVVKVLRGDPEEAQRLRRAIVAALPGPKENTVFDIFGSDLPDEVFEGVFDQPRQSGWRDVDL